MMSDRNLRLQVVLNAVDKITSPLKSAKTNVKSLSTAVRESREQLKQLGGQRELIDTFRKTSAKAAITAQNLKVAKSEVESLAIQFKKTAKPTAQQAKLLHQAKERVKELQRAYNGLRVSAQNQREGLLASGINTRKLNDAQKQLKERITSATEALERQEQQLKKVGEQQRKLHAAKSQYSKTLEVRDRIAGAGASSMGAGIAMGMPVFNAVKSYSAMEDAMKGVAKQVNGLLDDNGGRTAKYHEMQKEIQRLSETLPMANGAMDIAALVEGGARMGVANDKDPWDKQKKDLLNFAAVSAKASKAFEMPADQLAEDLGKIAFLYKIPIKSIEDLGDTLNYLDDNAQSKGADIINVMQRMGDIADKMDYKQAAALGSTFLSLGAAPEVAASASKAMVRELGIASMQSKRFSDGMKALGLDASQLEKGVANNAVGTIRDVLGRIKGLSKDKQLIAMTQLFGKEFGDDAQKLGLNVDEFIRQLDLTQKAGAKGSMQRESDIDKDSLSSQYLLLKTGVTNTFSSLGETLREPLMEVINLAKQATGAFRRFVEENPRLAGVLMKTAAGLSALLVVMGSIAVAAAAVIGPMAVTRFSLSMLGVKTLPSLTSAVTKAGGAFAWLASSPLSFMRRGIASSGNRVGLLSKVFNSLGASVRLVGKALKAIAGVPLTVIRAGMSALSRIVGIVFHPIAALRGGLSLLGRALSFLVSGPMALLRLALYGISGLLAALLSPIGLVVTALAGVALVIWKHWQPISAFLSGVVEGFQSAAAPISAAFEPLKPVFQWIGDKVQALYGWFADLLMPIKYTSAELQSATAMGRQFGESLAAGLNMVMHPLESLKSGISWLLEKLGVVSKEAAKAKLPEEVTRQLPSTVSGNGKVLLPAGSFSSMGFAGMYDSGGYIPSGQFGIVGERGPELVNGPARVTSRKQTAVMAAVAALGMSAAVPAAAAPLHPMSLPAAEYRTSPMVSVKQNAAPVVSTGKTEIHIHAAANQSPQDIARIVMQAMDERDRKLQARARSQFSDREMF